MLRIPSFSYQLPANLLAGSRFRASGYRVWDTMFWFQVTEFGPQCLGVCILKKRDSRILGIRCSVCSEAGVGVKDQLPPDCSAVCGLGFRDRIT